MHVVMKTSGKNARFHSAESILTKAAKVSVVVSLGNEWHHSLSNHCFAFDHSKYPWRRTENKFIKNTLTSSQEMFTSSYPQFSEESIISVLMLDVFRM